MRFRTRSQEVEAINWDETMELNKLFVGKSVKKVDDEHLLLSEESLVLPKLT